MTRTTMRWLRSLALSSLVLLAAAGALALGLDEAKAKGLVGERPDGYVGIVVDDPSPEVRSLVAQVNAKRKGVYEDIARKRGTSVEAVAALAGQDLVAKAGPGEWVLRGAWVKK